MKKKLIIVLTCLIVAICTTSCTTNKSVSEWGLTKEITLEPGEKLENISWQSKNDSLWIQTRPMRKDETAETHYFRQSSNYGIFEGEIIIIEQEEE